MEPEHPGGEGWSFGEFPRQGSNRSSNWGRPGDPLPEPERPMGSFYTPGNPEQQEAVKEEFRGLDSDQAPPGDGAYTDSKGAAEEPSRRGIITAGALKLTLIGLGVLALMILAVAALLAAINTRGDREVTTAVSEEEPRVQPAVVEPVDSVETVDRPVVTTAPTAPAPSEGAPTADAQAQPPLSTDSGSLEEATMRVLEASVMIETDTGQGSGFFYSPEGHIYTAAHVVEGDTSVLVRLNSGYRIEGEVLGANAEYDVAVVKISTDEVSAGEDFEVAALAEPGTVQVPEDVLAVGSPFGQDNSVTKGVVSKVGRVPDETGVSNVPVVGMIQIDASINFGNSGGALADAQGKVIGMNVAIISAGGGGNNGVGFATPIEVVQQIGDLILSGEELNPGYLGITGTNPELGDPGAEITTVIEGAPADLAGMRVGDLIVEVDGQAVKSIQDLVAILRLKKVGTGVDVDVIRDGRRLGFILSLSSRDLFDE